MKKSIFIIFEQNLGHLGFISICDLFILFFSLNRLVQIEKLLIHFSFIVNHFESGINNQKNIFIQIQKLQMDQQQRPHMHVETNKLGNSHPFETALRVQESTIQQDAPRSPNSGYRKSLNIRRRQSLNASGPRQQEGQKNYRQSNRSEGERNASRHVSNRTYQELEKQRLLQQYTTQQHLQHFQNQIIKDNTAQKTPNKNTRDQYLQPKDVVTEARQSRQDDAVGDSRYGVQSPYKTNAHKQIGIVPYTPMDDYQTGQTSNQNTFDDLKSIDEYKAKISSNIRNNKDAGPIVQAELARHSVPSNTKDNRGQKYVGEKLNQLITATMEQKRMTTNPSDAGKTPIKNLEGKHLSPQEQIFYDSRTFSPHSFNENGQGGFLPVIEKQGGLFGQNHIIQNQSRMANSPTPIQQQQNTSGNWPERSSGSRLLMQNGATPQNVLYTLQQHANAERRIHNQSNLPKSYDSRAQETQQKQMIAMAQVKQQMSNMTTPNNRGDRNMNAITPNGMKPKINDRQMEDLNETLQRLAREKLQNANKFGTTVHNDKIQRRLKINQRMTEKNAQLLAMEQLKLQEEQGGYSPIKKQKVKKKNQAADLMKQKLEHQQRNALLMGGDLISTRLQGVGKQSKPPLSNSPDKKTKEAVQSQQPGIDRKKLESTQTMFPSQNIVIDQQKVYKIQIDNIKLTNQERSVKQSPENIHANSIIHAHQTSQSQISQYAMGHIYDESPKVQQNISVNMEQKRNTTGNNSPLATQREKDQMTKNENIGPQRIFVKSLPPSSIEPSTQSIMRQSQQSVTIQTPTQNQNQAPQQNPSAQIMRNKLTLAVPMQFSSVIEDVELEQQVSPSPNNKRERRMQEERKEYSSVRGSTSRNQAGIRINLMNGQSQQSSSALSSQQMFKGIGETESLINIHTTQNQTQQASAFRNSYMVIQPGAKGLDHRSGSPQDAGYLTNQTNTGAKTNSFSLQQPQQNLHHQSEINFKDVGGENQNKVSMIDFGQMAIQDNQSQQNLKQLSSHRAQTQEMENNNLRINLIKVGSPKESEAVHSGNPKNFLQIDLNQHIKDGSKSQMKNNDYSSHSHRQQPRIASSTTRQSHTNLNKNEGSQSSQQQFGGGFRRNQQPGASTTRKLTKTNTAQLNQLELPHIARQRDRAAMNMQSRESRNFEQQRLNRKESSTQELNTTPHGGNQNSAMTGRSKLPPKSPHAVTNQGSPNKNDKKYSPNKGGFNVRNQGKGKRVSNFLTLNKVPSEKSIDNGYVSSDAPESVHCLKLGIRVPKEYTSFAKSYCQHKNYKKVPKAFRHMYTQRVFRKTKESFVWSQRMFLSNECASSEYRRMMPILILNLDGAVGYWEKNVYILRKGVVDSLISLSYDFRLIAVSSQRQKKIWKVIYALMNMAAGPSDANNNQMRHLVFDAVYQLCTENEDHKDRSFVKNIDEVHFDLTQVLLDMQFKQHIKKEVLERAASANKYVTTTESTYKTFWETENYRPFKKILIFTTEKYLEKSTCYSFDYNYLFQASKYIHEEDKKAPIVLQMPHLRLNPRLAFDAINQLIFTLQYLAHANNLQQLEDQIHQNGSVYKNPNYSPYELCKKLLSGKWKALERKMRTQANVRGLRIFDQKQDPFVDLDAIDFSKAYKVLKDYFKRSGENERISDWLKIKKYYLKLKPAKKRDLSPEKIKQNLKVTFNESPEIHHREEKDRGSRANATTHDSSKSDRISNVKNQYISEEAKNLYNGLMIRNYKIQQEINAFARHIRIQNQRKQEVKKQMQLEQQQEEELGSPIIIFDGDKEMLAERKSILRSSLKKSSILKPRKDVKKPEEPKPQKKEKEYALKYRVLKVKTGDGIYEYADFDWSKHNLINLKSKPLFHYAQIYSKGGYDDNGYAQQSSTPTPTLDAQAIQQLQSYIASHSYSSISHSDQLDPRNLLTEMLSKRQTKISYGTTQEMHLKNNLNQLENGEKQYQEQHKIITENEKAEKHEAQKQEDSRPAPVSTHRAFNKEKLTTQEYIDQL